MAYPFFTIGHSTYPLRKFIELLTASEIGIVVDVRTIPRSRTNPQYNREALPGSLSEFQIAYEHIAELGGLLLARPTGPNNRRGARDGRRSLRPPRREARRPCNAAWICDGVLQGLIP